MEQDGDNFFSPLHEEMDVHVSDLERFAELVRADEREACAKVCEDIYNDPKGNDGYDCYYTRPYLECADAIRARGEASIRSQS